MSTNGCGHRLVNGRCGKGCPPLAHGPFGLDWYESPVRNKFPWIENRKLNKAWRRGMKQRARETANAVQV